MAVFKEENRNVFIDGEVCKIEIYEKGFNKLIKSTVSGIYQNDLSFIRELVSNAIDAGGDKPVEFNLVEEQPLLNKEACIEIIDYGVGMSTEFVREYYTKLGYSTKEEDKEAIGAYGVGRLSVLKYSDQFTVETNHKGIKTIFVGSINEKAEYVLNIQSVTDTTNVGTKVVIPIKTDNGEISRIKEYVRNCFNFNDKQFICNFGLYNKQIYYENEDFVIYKTNVTYDTLLGDLCYNIYPEGLSKNIVLKFKIGELKPIQSREEIDLSYSKKSIEDKVDKVKCQILDLMKTNVPTLLESLTQNDVFYNLAFGKGKLLNYKFKHDLQYEDLDYIWVLRSSYKKINTFNVVSSADDNSFLCYGNTLTDSQLKALKQFGDNVIYVDISNPKVSQELLQDLKDNYHYVDSTTFKAIKKQSKRTNYSRKYIETTVKVLKYDNYNSNFKFTIREMACISEITVVYCETENETALINLYKQMYNTNIVFCKLSKDVIKQIKDLPNFIHYSNVRKQDLINHFFANYIKKVLYFNTWIYRIFPLTAEKYKEYSDKFVTYYESKLNKIELELYKQHSDYVKFEEFCAYIKSFELDYEETKLANSGKLTLLIKTKLEYDNNSFQ